MNRYEDNITLLSHIEKDLIQAGWLIRPVCYFDKSSVDAQTIKEYTKIITRFGGIVVDDPSSIISNNNNNTNHSIQGGESSTRSDVGGLNQSQKKKRKKNKQSKQSTSISPSLSTSSKPTVTHVIAWDKEEHDSKTTLQDEETSPFATNYDIVEKLYLRPITIFDPRKQMSNSQSNIVETNMMETKKKGGRLGGKGKKGKSPNDPNSNPLLEQKMPLAFVHWWYLPNSYDEFMLASDVDGDDSDIPPKPDSGPWVVGCKFIRDVQKFNEWGLEADYTIVDL
jgi:hypothetical protein